MRRALDFFVIEGIKTTIPLHREILRRPGLPRRAGCRRASWSGFAERAQAEGGGRSSDRRAQRLGRAESTPSPTAEALGAARCAAGAVGHGGGRDRRRCSCAPSGSPDDARAARRGERCAAALDGWPGQLWIDDRVDLGAAAARSPASTSAQGDLAGRARRAGCSPATVRIGLSTHDEAPARGRPTRDPAVDWVALGPIFATRSKARPGPGGRTRAACAPCADAPAKPLVAIGGIDAANLARRARGRRGLGGGASRRSARGDIAAQLPRAAGAAARARADLPDRLHGRRQDHGRAGASPRGSAGRSSTSTTRSRSGRGRDGPRDLREGAASRSSARIEAPSRSPSSLRQDPAVVATGGGTLTFPAQSRGRPLRRPGGLAEPDVRDPRPPHRRLGKNDRPLFRDEATAFWRSIASGSPPTALADLTVDVAAGRDAAEEVAARIAPAGSRSARCST